MFDVAVVGLGPAGRALASRSAVSGLSVLAIDPRPDAAWRPTYGIWRDELGYLPQSVVRSSVENPQIRARGIHPLPRAYAVLDNAAVQEALPLTAVTEVRRARLSDADVSALRAEARVVVDARGARPSSPGADSRAPSPDPAPAQTAYGIVVPAEVAAPALDGAEGLLMDWRTDWATSGDRRPGSADAGPATFLYAFPMGQGRTLLEETCLAAAPALGVAELKRRLHRRLIARGISEEAIDDPFEREIVWIPMRGRARAAPDGVLALGTAGRGGNLVTGYSVAHSLKRADDLARAIASGTAPRAIDPPGPADVPREAGLRALLRLDVAGTVALFEAFGHLPPRQQRDFMSRDSTAPGLAMAMWGMFLRMPASARRELIRATLGR